MLLFLSINKYDVIITQVAYQKILQLSYIDKFLSDIQLEFRNKYKDDLQSGRMMGNLDFSGIFNSMLKQTEDMSRMEAKLTK